jgi:hypothetical protein
MGTALIRQGLQAHLVMVLLLAFAPLTLQAEEYTRTNQGAGSIAITENDKHGTTQMISGTHLSSFDYSDVGFDGAGASFTISTGLFVTAADGISSEFPLGMQLFFTADSDPSALISVYVICKLDGVPFDVLHGYGVAPSPNNWCTTFNPFSAYFYLNGYTDLGKPLQGAGHVPFMPPESGHTYTFDLVIKPAYNGHVGISKIRLVWDKEQGGNDDVAPGDPRGPDGKDHGHPQSGDKKDDPEKPGDPPPKQGPPASQPSEDPDVPDCVKDLLADLDEDSATSFLTIFKPVQERNYTIEIPFTMPGGVSKYYYVRIGPESGELAADDLETYRQWFRIFLTALVCWVFLRSVWAFFTRSWS